MKNKNVLTSIKKLVDYLDYDEEKHWEESDKPKYHIYLDIIKVKDWLKTQKKRRQRIKQN